MKTQKKGSLAEASALARLQWSANAMRELQLGEAQRYRLVGWLVGWLVGSLVGWLVRWLVSWLVGWLVGSLVG